MLSLQAGISRETIRACERLDPRVKIENFDKVSSQLGCKLSLCFHPVEDCRPEDSVLALSYDLERDGESSWKIHIFNFVDSFRRVPDSRMLILPPKGSLEIRLQALIRSVVLQLCEEVELDPPEWARVPCFLPRPWFVSEIESLKASAILESGIHFRRNNIFVLNNFLKRA